MRVHDGWDGVVVDVAVAFGDVFDRGDGFFFGFVGEHGAEGAVADDADVGKLGAILLVDDEATFVVDLETDVFKTEAGGIGAATYGYEYDVRIELGSKSVKRASKLEIFWGLGINTVSCLPPLAASTLTLTVSPLSSPSRTFVPSLNFIPCFSNIFFVVFEISASMPGPPI